MTTLLKGLCPLLQVYNMPTAIHFYRNLVGFSVVRTSPPLTDDRDNVHWVLLECDGIELMLNTAYDQGERPVVPDALRIAAHFDTTIYFGCSDIDRAYQNLLARGVEIKEPPHVSHGMKGFSFKDPDGFGIFFHWPVDLSCEKS